MPGTNPDQGMNTHVFVSCHIDSFRVSLVRHRQVVAAWQGAEVRGPARVDCLDKQLIDL